MIKLHKYWNYIARFGNSSRARLITIFPGPSLVYRRINLLVPTDCQVGHFARRPEFMNSRRFVESGRIPETRASGSSLAREWIGNAYRLPPAYPALQTAIHWIMSNRAHIDGVCFDDSGTRTPALALNTMTVALEYNAERHFHTHKFTPHPHSSLELYVDFLFLEWKLDSDCRP